jgi:hypothetical protein
MYSLSFATSEGQRQAVKKIIHMLEAVSMSSTRSKWKDTSPRKLIKLVEPLELLDNVPRSL